MSYNSILIAMILGPKVRIINRALRDTQNGTQLILCVPAYQPFRGENCP